MVNEDEIIFGISISQNCTGIIHNFNSWTAWPECVNNRVTEHKDLTRNSTHSKAGFDVAANLL